MAYLAVTEVNTSILNKYYTRNINKQTLTRESVTDRERRSPPGAGASA
jgi:hypothetical protein